MTNPPLDIRLGAPDPSATPLNIVELFSLIDSHLFGQILGEYMTYTVSNTAPSVDDGRIWFKIDSVGRPIALMKYYNGRWRRVYNGMLGEIRIFSGYPTNNVIWDTDGRGKPGEEYDGWQICNGNNGSPNLSDKFILAGHMDNSAGHSGYSSGWQSFIDGSTDQHDGGVAKITLDNTNTYRPDIPAVRARFWSANANAPAPHTGDLWGIKSSSNNSDNDDIAPAIPGNTTPDDIKTLPPFIAMGLIIFLGYE